MATQDYTEFTEVANELIDEFGRPVTLLKTSRTPHTSSKPYLGPANVDNSNPAINHKLPVTAVSVGEITGGMEGRLLTELLGSTIRLIEDGFLVKGPDALGVEIDDFNAVLDGNTMFRIRKVHPQKPGDTVVYYWLEVEN